MRRIYLALSVLSLSLVIFSESVSAQFPSGIPTGVVQPSPGTMEVTPPVKNCEYVAPTNSPQYRACYQCIADKSGSWTVFGCIPSRPQDFIAIVLKFCLGIGGGIAFMAMLFGSFMLLTSAGDPQRINGGKQILTYSIIGLLVILFSVFILQLIGIQILGLPGFGK